MLAVFQSILPYIEDYRRNFALTPALEINFPLRTRQFDTVQTVGV